MNSSENMDLSLLERVNPVFNTAKMTLYQLSASGNEYAGVLAEKLGLTYDETQNSKNIEISPETYKTSIIVMETRYRTMMALALASNCRTAVDLPCGYTPRAIEFARMGKSFAGLDLPATIAEAEPAIRSMLKDEEQKLAGFHSVDATNYASMREAFAQIEGEVCITTEGLMMYLTESEATAFVDNIKRILGEHGGCWITADPEVSMQYAMTTMTVAGEDYLRRMQKDKTKTEEKSDVKLNGNSLLLKPGPAFAEDIQKAVAFLAAHGLKAERIPVAEYMPELNSLTMVSEEQAEQIRQSMRKCYYWKMTVSGEKGRDGEKQEESGKFHFETSVDGDVLRLRLSGRMDTLTSPSVLDAYEKLVAKHQVKSVCVDCERLEYVSSAGLRVWLIMHKGCPDGVTLTGTNELVREILEQTGFDQLISTM